MSTHLKRDRSASSQRERKVAKIADEKRGQECFTLHLPDRVLKDPNQFLTLVISAIQKQTKFVSLKKMTPEFEDGGKKISVHIDGEVSAVEQAMREFEKVYGLLQELPVMLKEYSAEELALLVALPMTRWRKETVADTLVDVGDSFRGSTEQCGGDACNLIKGDIAALLEEENINCKNEIVDLPSFIQVMKKATLKIPGEEGWTFKTYVENLLACVRKGDSVIYNAESGELETLNDFMPSNEESSGEQVERMGEIVAQEGDEGKENVQAGNMVALPPGIVHGERPAALARKQVLPPGKVHRRRGVPPALQEAIAPVMPGLAANPAVREALPYVRSMATRMNTVLSSVGPHLQTFGIRHGNALLLVKREGVNWE